jgi:hypothetical protein
MCKHLDFGPNLDSSLRAGKRVPIEVNRDHPADWDGERLLRAGDYFTVSVGEALVYDDSVRFADVSNGKTCGLATREADRTPIDDEGLGLARTEREEGEHEGDEH